MANLIPGLGNLGYSFDIDGRYGPSSTRFQLFELDPDGSEQTYAYKFPDGGEIDYRYPTGVTVEDTPASQGKSEIFAGRSEYSEHFKSQAGLQGSVGTRFVGFSGEFDASYSEASSSDQEYWYGLYDAHSWFWEVKLPDPGPDRVLASVKSSSIYQNVPESFDPSDPANARAFFDFFDKYGTHFTRSVTVGGRLYYNVLVSRSAFSSQSEMAAQLDAEFKAYFVKGGAEAAAEWEEVSQQWMENRTVEITALGGTPDILLSLSTPDRGNNANGAYEGWLKTLPEHPAEVSFQLEPVSLAFGGSRAEAVGQAIDAYLGDSIFAESRYESAGIWVKAREQFPDDGGPRAESSGARVTVADSRLGVVLDKTYQHSWAAIGSEYRQMYEEILADLDQHRSADQVVTLSLFGMVSYYFPTFDLYQYLVDLGAGADLEAWESLSKGGYSEENRQVNYVLIGVPGSRFGTAFEALSTSGSRSLMTTDGNPGWWAKYDIRAAPAVSRMARVHRDLPLTPGTAEARIVLGPRPGKAA